VIDFTLPELGENITTAEVLQVLVKAGDALAKDQPVLELETDKATIEVPSSVAGQIKDVKVKAGDKVSVGQAILSVDDSGASAPQQQPAKKGGAPAAAAKAADGPAGSAPGNLTLRAQAARSAARKPRSPMVPRGHATSLQTRDAGPRRTAGTRSSTSAAARARPRSRRRPSCRSHPPRLRCAGWRASSASTSIRSAAAAPMGVFQSMT
jgi:pyruvate/2-oxoglutarate dehydrogenase complex dihydrolipoamide acyltransferase (E2) component